MARTKQTARKIVKVEKDLKELNSFKRTPDYRIMNQSEQKIRKYYPKRSKLFFKGLIHQYQDQKTLSHDSKTRILQRYKRDFFKSFSANWKSRVFQPAKIPQNIEYLTISNGSKIFLKKLIGQNKRLKHIELACSDHKLALVVLKCLKYSKCLCAITFSEQSFPFMLNKQWERIFKSCANTIQEVEICGDIGREYFVQPEEFTKVMETVFQFPKLKRVGFQAQIEPISEYFPFAKLQKLKEQNISSNINIQNFRQNPESLIGKTLKFSQDNYVKIDMRSFYEKWGQSKSNWNLIENRKREIRNLCKHVFSLDISELETFYLPELLPVFKETQALELISPVGKWDEADYSSIAQLSNLRVLSVSIDHNEEEISFENLFLSLYENIKNHKKLETLFLQLSCQSGLDDTGEKAVVSFFEACSETLRKAYFDFKYLGEYIQELQPFFEGLSKLQHLQYLAISISVRFSGFDEIIEELCQKRILDMKTLEELDFKIETKSFDQEDEIFNLVFPAQLKRLALRMDISSVPFEPTKTLWSLSDLTYLEFEFLDFGSQEWSKILQDLEKLKKLEILILKETKKNFSSDSFQQMKRKLDRIMKEFSSLKLIILVNNGTLNTMVFKRNYSWSDLNKIINEFTLQQADVKFHSILNYV